MLQRELDRKSDRLAVKDKQIAELNERLSECSAALLAAQALHAEAIQQQLTEGAVDLEQERPYKSEFCTGKKEYKCI